MCVFEKRAFYIHFIIPRFENHWLETTSCHIDSSLFPVSLVAIRITKNNKICTQIFFAKNIQRGCRTDTIFYTIDRLFENLKAGWYIRVWRPINIIDWCLFVSSVRSSNSHPDLLVTQQQQHPTFSVTHWSSTLDLHFLSHYSYIKAIMLYKGNHWT